MQVLSARVAALESPTFTYDPGVTLAYSSGSAGVGQVGVGQVGVGQVGAGQSYFTLPAASSPTARSGFFGSIDPKDYALFASDKAFVRNLEGKTAVITDYSTDRDGKVTVTVEGEQVRLTKEQWEKLPLWTGSFPVR